MKLKTVATVIAICITLLTFAPSVASESNGCWYPGAFATEQEIANYGDIAFYLLVQEAGYSDSCNPSDMESWMFRCTATDVEGSTVYTPPVTIQEIGALGQPIVPEQTLVPAQPVAIVDDVEVVAIEDSGCAEFGPGGSNPVVVGVRLEYDGASLTVRSDDFALSSCFEPGAPDFPCEDVVGSLLASVLASLHLVDTNDDGIPETFWLDRDGDNMRNPDGSEDSSQFGPGPVEPVILNCADAKDVEYRICYGGGGVSGYYIWLGGPIGFGLLL